MAATWCVAGPPAASPASAVVRSEFIFKAAKFPSAHASTIAETKQGLVAAWFGGSREGAADVGIWSARLEKGKWTPPVEVANGRQADGKRYACWNPVLFQLGDDALLLFHKVGLNPRDWWGMVRTSRDGGRTWGEARRLPAGIVGPSKNKPVQLANGSLVSPSSTETQRKSLLAMLVSESSYKWRVHFELSSDGGQTWTAVAPPAAADGSQVEAIQPSILIHPGGRLQAMGRTRDGRIFETWSNNGGRTWTPLALTVLPNPNSGLDAVTLRDGRQLIVYNHTLQGRSPLNVAISRDGKSWEAASVLESGPGEYSYPAVIQTRDGLVHITYTWKRQRIKHVVLDPVKLQPVPMPDGKWPPQVAGGGGVSKVRANPLRVERQRWARQDSNLGPRDYESPALTAELQAHL